MSYDDCSELLQLIKAKPELPSPDINGICERSRVPVCFKTNIMFYSGCMTFAKYKCRISDAVSSVLLDLCVAVQLSRVHKQDTTWKFLSGLKKTQSVLHTCN